jgi:cupin 2 domain-containing protein
MGDTMIEQILSGALDQPIGYDQDHDEWVVLLSGGAELEVEGEPLSMSSGDWVLLRRRTPHRLVRTTPGTSWLAVHVETR